MKKTLLIIFSIFIGLMIYPFGTSYGQKQLWGVTYRGGQYDAGIIFKTDGSGDNQTVEKDFFQVEGSNPVYSQLIQATDGKLYGMTSQGDSFFSFGVLFQYDPATSTYTKKYEFTGPDGGFPQGSLIQASNGKLYGMASGGANYSGVLFEFDPATSIYTKKFDFGGTNGQYPNGSLIQASDGKLYGMTNGGGTSGAGVLFQFDPITSTCTKKIDFTGTNGWYPLSSSLIEATDGKLYGMTPSGGTSYQGNLFQYDPATSTITNKFSFSYTGTNGKNPYGSLMQASDGMLYGMTSTGGANDMGVLFQFDPVASTFTKKLDFDGAANGSKPYGSLMQTSDGMLYGMTYQGGANDLGVLFQYDPAASAYSKKLDFAGATNGSKPEGSLMQASDGKLYGMTNLGGLCDAGILFQYDLSISSLTKKIEFGGVDGKNFSASLMQASDGMLYGTSVRVTKEEYTIGVRCFNTIQLLILILKSLILMEQQMEDLI